MLLVGQMAAAVASATRQLFAPDLWYRRIEHAKQVLVRDQDFGEDLRKDLRSYLRSESPHLALATQALATFIPELC